MKQFDRPKFSDLVSKLKEQSRKSKEKWEENNKKFCDDMKKSSSDLKKMQEDWKQTKSMMPKFSNPFGKKCLKCNSHNIKTIKAGFMKHLMQQNIAIWVPGAKISKPLNVCRDCGFSWEDR